MDKKKLKKEFNDLVFDHLVTSSTFYLKYPIIYQEMNNEYDLIGKTGGSLEQNKLISQLQNVLIGATKESPKQVLRYLKETANNKQKQILSKMNIKNEKRD